MKVGDRVEHSKFGKGTVVYIDSSSLPILVQFDKPNQCLHNGTNVETVYKDHTCYWFNEDDLNPLEIKIKEKINEQITIPLPERYIINENATILFWENGEKTVVKKCVDDEFNPRLAFLTAFFQHYCGMSKNKANKYLANLQVEVKEEKPKPKTESKSKHIPKHMKEEPEFKIGDRVEVIKGDGFSQKGWIGKIINVGKDNLIRVEYDNGHHLWIANDQLKLIKEEK